MLVDQSAFDAVVLQGALGSRGMGSFAGRLQPADTLALRAYLVSMAESARNAAAAAPPGVASPPPRP
jgi:hypothetical protein